MFHDTKFPSPDSPEASGGNPFIFFLKKNKRLKRPEASGAGLAPNKSLNIKIYIILAQICVILKITVL
ncbi:hypothetical protein BXU01_08525 [[Flexibacter] sp. ATCC 35103]|nr:hypothetical protein BXU01_08525 [[Flexibacter] sp. ATCC 35103]